MARNLTKAQLVDQLIALREHCDRLETKLCATAELLVAAAAPESSVAAWPRYTDRQGRVFEKRTVRNGFSTQTRHVQVGA